MISRLPFSYWLLLLTILLLPWYVIRFNIFGIPFTLLEVVLLLTVAVWVVELAMGRVERPKTKLLSWLPGAYTYLLLGAVVLMVASATISVVVSSDLRAGLGIYKAYILEPLALGVVAVSVVRSRSEWLGLVGAFMGVVVQVSGLSISQWLWHWPVFAPAEMAQGRSTATFNSANAIGLLIGPLVLLLGSVGVKLQDWRRLVFLITGLLGMIAMLLSQSEGAIGALAIGIAWIGAGGWLANRYKVVRRSFKYAILGLLTIYVVAILGFMAFGNHPPQVNNPYTRPDFTTFTVRQCVWEGTWKGLQDGHVFSGFGLAGFSQKYLEYATCDAEPLVYPHNLLLNFWVELGLLGLLLVVWVIALWLYLTDRLMNDVQIEAYFALALVGAPVYWLVHGLVDVPFFKNDLSIVWWVLLALALRSGAVWHPAKER